MLPVKGLTLGTANGHPDLANGLVVKSVHGGFQVKLFGKPSLLFTFKTQLSAKREVLCSWVEKAGGHLRSAVFEGHVKPINNTESQTEL